MWIDVKTKLPKHEQMVLILLNECNIYHAGKPYTIQVATFEDNKKNWNEMPKNNQEAGYYFLSDKEKKYFANKSMWKNFNHYIEINPPRYQFYGKQNYSCFKEKCFLKKIGRWYGHGVTHWRPLPKIPKNIDKNYNKIYNKKR